MSASEQGPKKLDQPAGSDKTTGSVPSWPWLDSSGLTPLVEKWSSKASGDSAAVVNPHSDMSLAADVATKKPRFQLTFRHKVAAFVWFTVIMAVAMLLLRDLMLKMGDWGYLGAFIINGLSSATLVLPAPGGAVIILMARDYDPLLLGITSGLGGAVGSLTAYWVGMQSRNTLERGRLFRFSSRIFGRVGHLILLIGTSIPFIPMDFASIVAGATRYPLRKYMVYTSIGSIIRMTMSTYGASFYFEWFESAVRPLF